MAWRAWEGKGLPGEPVREMLIEAVEKRFGAVEAVPEGHLLEFLSDNGGAYTAQDTGRIASSLGLKPINTPVSGASAHPAAHRTFLHSALAYSISHFLPVEDVRVQS